MYCVIRPRSSQCFLTIKSMCIVLLLLSIASGKVSAGLNYGEALTKSLLYFEAQRSGKLPSDQRVQWRGDSAPGDGSDVHIDLSGGYYDAGDNMKFGFPLAFTTTMLAWGSVEMASQLHAHNEHQNVLMALKWATDYLIKAHPEPNVLYGQVGDGKLDHACWMRPEDMNTSHPRPSYRIDAQHPGADLAGETAAAMAAASLAFAPSDAAYANTLISHARDLFEFGKNHPGVYHDSITNAAGFYTSSGHEDELLWAAAWLHRATGDQMYLDYLTQASNSGGVRYAFSWDDKFVGAQVLAAKLVFEGKVKNEGKMAEYKRMAEQFICNCAQKGYSNVKKTPGGLLWFLPWENLQYTATASFVLSSYSKYLEAAQASVQCPNGVLQASDLLGLARAQVDYILGSNPKSMSYMVGFGTNYPNRPHHRGASIVSIKKDPKLKACNEGWYPWYKTSEPNPNVLVGAIVGGPDVNDVYQDERSDYQHNEPDTVTVAPFVGVFAALA
ncbi:Endoglucanase 15 [Raphanus sativus]|uniref:Endoglucanase n=1 Tax=Raphanus sativus TaxID=3726 RepID=A0A9W3D275_RAPSA|nr:endoglucanase 15-like [Raphanus sativus]KAJ4866195.1 Endoglucanase 15 [Raphanus sativus]